MRLLHTSDWHLGRSLHREDLLGAQGEFVDALVATVRAEAVDVVLVSGDVYDRALPPVDAVSLCDEALGRLAAEKVRVVLISGNHDSVTRLGFGSGLFDAAGIHVRTDPLGSGRPVLLEDRHGPVAVYAIPYLEPDSVRAALGCDGRGHEAVLGAAMTSVRADLVTRPAGTRSVALAHAFITGARPCDSERDISVGGLSIAPAALFAGIHYTALGHLHGAQDVGAREPFAAGGHGENGGAAGHGAGGGGGVGGVHARQERVRYSGSPLAYSFSEEHQRKAMWLVDLDQHGVADVTEVPCPVRRPLSRVAGRLEDLLTARRWSAHTGHYLQVTLTDPVRPRDPMERLRARFPHVLVLDFAPEGGRPADASSYAGRVRGRSDLDLAAGFVEHVRQRPVDADEADLLRTAFEEMRRREALV
jgi:exonuclease SbcD